MAESHRGILHQDGGGEIKIESDNLMIQNVGAENQLIQVRDGDQNRLIQVHVVDESNHTVRVLNMDQNGLFSNS